MNRRRFTILSTGTAVSVAGWARARIAGEGEGYFTVRRERGRWLFRGPDQRPFFSLGVAPARHCGLVTDAEIEELRRHYGRDVQEWIAPEGSSPFERAAFNSYWSQPSSGTAPYCHLVPFSVAGLWNVREQQCNYLHSDWEEWCDHLAREHCLPRAEERNLIGYFYNDGPCWLHDRPNAEWRGPLYDPDLLRSPSGRRRLRELAQRYYQVTHDAIRRYDPHHLLLGDRYDGSLALPPEVVEEAHARVDVFSIQEFRHPARSILAWHERSARPVLLVDAAPIYPALDREIDWYSRLLRELLKNPGCVGCHLAGAGEDKATSTATGTGTDRGGAHALTDKSDQSLLMWRRVNVAAERWVARQA